MMTCVSFSFAGGIWDPEALLRKPMAQFGYLGFLRWHSCKNFLLYSVCGYEIFFFVSWGAGDFFLFFFWKGKKGTMISSLLSFIERDDCE